MNLPKSLYYSVFLFLALNSVAFGQCDSAAKLRSFKRSLSNNELGELIVDINTQGQFKATLYKFSGINEQFIKEIEGVGSRQITFDNLTANSEYRLKLSFLSETKFPCSNRILDELRIDETN